MPNLGAIPVDITAPRGLVRNFVGDLTFAPTANAGEGDFNYFSDAEIDAFLTVGNDNPYRAAAFAFLQWAAVAADEAVNISDVDLKVDLTKRATLLAERADYYMGKADLEDEKTAVGDAFTIVPTGRQAPTRAAELAYPGWDYSW